MSNDSVVQIRIGNTIQLRVCFHWHDDRFRHEWLVVCGESKYQLMSGELVDRDAAWPSEPPLQDLTLEHRDDHDVVLGLGQAGSAHWSSSFAAFPSKSQIVIEHACRVASADSELRSRYRLHSTELLTIGMHNLAWRVESATCRFEAMHSKMTVVDQRCIEISPRKAQGASTGRGNATHLWGFRMILDC
ncbi:MAG TPA: hypothetical protein PKD64_15825 [Pirellulaceae bacterium]|nr:hypothetical protein [Pirellulaceae bacterium]HMO93656.1 hypothetical protein [Pirellulaceae bacterium]HMP70660.1 hypothetical protein [Pirellulaceae bacterium]